MYFFLYKEKVVTLSLEFLRIPEKHVYQKWFLS